MNTYIGGNIRDLRYKKDITQEELADYMNISFQSVSKWERGESMPDISALASLATFFDVSTDELLGMDKIRGDIFTNDFWHSINSLIRDEKYEEAIDKLRSAQKTYPNKIGINSQLALALALRGTPDDRDESIELCRRILGKLRDEKVKTSVRTALFLITKSEMPPAEALKQVKDLTHIWECRELITAELYSGREREDYLKWLIHNIISTLYSKIQSGGLSDEELLKTVFVGPSETDNDMETNLRMLERIKDFISK